MGQVRLLENLAHLIRRSIWLEQYCAGRFKLGNATCRLGKVCCVAIVDGKPFFGELGGWHQQIVQISPAVLFKYQRVGGQRPGHANRQRASRTQPGHDTVRTDVHITSCGGRSHLATVNRHQAFIGQTDEDKTASTQAGVVVVDYAEGQRGCHSGVDRIAALAKAAMAASVANGCTVATTQRLSARATSSDPQKLIIPNRIKVAGYRMLYFQSQVVP